MHRIITTIYWLLALSYITSTLTTTYSWSFLHKAAPILLLGVIVWKRASLSTRWWLIAGVLSSAAGDMLLALPLKHSFILGLSAFALAHILYSKFLFGWRNLNRLNLLTVSLFSAYLVVMLFLLLPVVGSLRLPVIGYFVVISVMFISALAANTQGYALRLGALLFLVSDSLLAINAFITPLPLQSVLVMSTYYAAQFFIVTGCIQLVKEPKGD